MYRETFIEIGGSWCDDYEDDVSSEIWHHVGFQWCVKISFGSLLVLNLRIYIENIDFPTGFCID
jgi:hypothetical protein